MDNLLGLYLQEEYAFSFERSGQLLSSKSITLKAAKREIQDLNYKSMPIGTSQFEC